MTDSFFLCYEPDKASRGSTVFDLQVAVLIAQHLYCLRSGSGTAKTVEAWKWTMPLELMIL